MSGRLPAAPEFTPRVLSDPGQPGTQAAFVAGQRIETIGDRIMRLAERRNARADAAAQEAAFDAGAAAGEAAPGSMMEGGGDLYRRAFNRAALEAGGRRLEITARQEFDRMAREHPADPQAFARAAQSWTAGTLEGMPEAFRTRLAPVLDALAGPYLRASQDQQDRRVADDRGATFTAALPLRLAAIERAGLRAATDQAARADLDREQAGLVGELVAMGPRAAFEFEGRQYPADPTRAARYSVEQMAEIRRRALDTEAIGVARGAFRAGPQTREWIADFERRAEAGEVPGLRPDQARAIADSFRRDLAQARADQTEAQRAARAALAGRIDADNAAILERGAPVSNILDSELAAAGFDVPTYRAQERARMLGWQARQDLVATDTPARAQELAEQWQPGGALFLADPATARQVLEFARERGARIRAADLQGTIQDRATELQRNAAQAVRHTRAVPAEWQPIVAQAAAASGVPEFLALALLGRESGGRADARSPAGAVGPAQIMPATAASPGFGMEPLPPEALTDPARAIPWAMRYYRNLLDKYQGNHEHALMAYNWGTGNVDGWLRGGRGGAVPAETRAYVAALLPAAGGDPSRPGTRLPTIVSPEEAIAAGQTPEWAAAASAQAAEAARMAALRTRAQTASPEDRAAIEAELAQMGERAAENARLAQAWAEALQEREQAIGRDPAGYVASTSPVLTELQQRVAQGELAALPALVDGLRREQARQGIPAQQQRALPQALAQGFFDQIAEARDPDAAEQALRGIVQAAGPADTARMFDGLSIAGAAQAERRQAIVVAAALAGRQDATARAILRGAFVLRDNTLPGQTAAAMEERLDRHAGAIFARAPDLRSQVSAAARAYYAAGLSDSGQLAAARFDPSRFQEALDAILPVARYAGRPVPLPPGMDARRFQDTMAALPPARLDGAMAADGSPITPALIARGGFSLDPLGPGRYLLRYGQYEVLDRRAPAGSRRPFVLDLAGAAPASPAGQDMAAADPRSIAGGVP